MSISKETRDDIVAKRLQQANETFSEINLLINNELWRTAINRLYYACFYAASALMVYYGFIVRTHSGLIGLLGLHFVKPNIISDETAFVIRTLFELRQKGDYDVWVEIKPQMVLSLVDPTKKFIETIEILLTGKNPPEN